MNQTFSLSRFIKYGAYQSRMRSKAMLLTVAGAFIALIFLMFFVLLGGGNWYAKAWQPFFYLTGAIAAVLFIGNSFPYFRKKDTTVSLIMIPVSIFEKFVYEYFSRIVLFTLLYPLFFYFVAHLVVPVVQPFFPKREFVPFHFNLLFPDFNREKDTLLFYYIIPALYILIASLFFVGAVIARRYPLVKTLVSVGVFVLLVFGYFYIIFETMNLGNGFGYFAERFWGKQENAIKTVFALIIFAIITTLTYTYFKLKEKEV